MSSDLAIRARGLSKKYLIRHRARSVSTLAEALVERLKHPLRRDAVEEFWALRDVSFDIRRGEVVGLIGRNGAGKSTLLKILSRITWPTEGEAELYGRVGSLLEVGTGFHQELTGRENIYLNGSILGMRRWEIRKEFDAIVDFAGVEQFLDIPVKRYSSGMYVRLAFAVAAHLRCEILVVDEVLAVGDAEFQKKCLGKMKQVSKDGRTVLFVSHNMAAVAALCSRVLVMRSGRIHADVPPAEAAQAYEGRPDAREGRIVDHCQFRDGSVQVHRILVNDSEADLQLFPGENSRLRVVVEGELGSPRRIALEGRLTDSSGLPLACFSPSRRAGGVSELPTGKFRVEHALAVPPTTRGEFVLHLSLAEPGVCEWVAVPDAVRLTCSGTPMGCGTVFEYARGNGWVVLKDIQPSDDPTDAGSNGRQEAS
jgi:lipopolysaccharide transport system ATP-binding protein